MKLAIIPLVLLSAAASATDVVQNNDNRHNFGNTTHRTTNNVTNHVDDSVHSNSVSSSTNFNHNANLNSNEAKANVNIDNTDFSFRSTNASSDNSVTVESTRQAPALGVYSNGPCSGLSFGLSVPIGGIGLGTIDEECSIRYAATLADHLGEHDLALMLLYNLNSVKDLLRPKEMLEKPNAWASWGN